MIQLTSENAKYLQDIMGHVNYDIVSTQECTKFINSDFEILVKNNNNIIVIDKRSTVKSIFKDLKTASKHISLA